MYLFIYARTGDGARVKAGRDTTLGRFRGLFRKIRNFVDDSLTFMEGENGKRQRMFPFFFFSSQTRDAARVKLEAGGDTRLSIALLIESSVNPETVARTERRHTAS